MNKAKRILLVDDDADDQFYFTDAIHEVNETVQCEIANNGREAIEQIKLPAPPDVIFHDLNMPVMNGYECLSYLKKEDRYKNIPVVIFTTSQNENNIERSRKMGAELFFTKPASFTTLCSKLGKILEMDFANLHFSL